MTLYRNREKFSGLSVKVGIVFSKILPRPNVWTVITIIPALLAFWSLVNEQFLYAAVWFIIAAFIDMIDGAVARVTGRATKKGAYLDTIMDRYVEAIVVFGLLFASLPNFTVPGYFSIPVYALVFIFYFGGFMTTYAKSAAKEKELVENELRGGLLERAERLLILFVGILLAIYNPLYLTYVIALLAVLTNITALQRIFIAKKGAK
jgi:phosphatidylglycerophosphate synthase